MADTTRRHCPFCGCKNFAGREESYVCTNCRKKVLGFSALGSEVSNWMPHCALTSDAGGGRRVRRHSLDFYDNFDKSRGPGWD